MPGNQALAVSITPLQLQADYRERYGPSELDNVKILDPGTLKLPL